MGKTGKYLYGIVASPALRFEMSDGATDSVDIHAIPHQDVAAVVSDCEIVDYKHLRKDVLAMLLVRHQKVLERIMELGHTIIPMRLGTFAADDAEVRDILSKGYRLIKEIIPKVQDKIEIDVAATWHDFNSILKEVGDEKEITELKISLLSNPKGVTVDDQMKVGFAIKKALDDKRLHVTDSIQDALKLISPDCRAHELMDDRMVMNCAFLISRAEQAAFYARIENLNEGFAERLDFRCVGPLPPYSFYTIEIKKLDFQDLDWARRKLGLSDDRATKSEIKKAYHRAAVSFHPDKNPDRPGMEKEFGNAARARKILAECCLASAQAGHEEDVFFNEDNFKERALLVKVGE